MSGQNKTILYFGNDWYAENRTSSHHIARQLAARYNVFYIECPGLRAPQAGGRDIRKVFQKIWKALRGSRQVMPGIRVCTLLQIPYHRFAFVRRLNSWLIRMSIRWLMWCNNIRSPIAWFVVPHLAALVGQLNETLSVYYCVDDYAALPNIDVASTRSMDEQLTRNADLVFVASHTLLPKKLSMNPNTVVSPHGVDVEHFGRAQDRNGPVPKEIRSLPKPIIGFFGLIEEWIDLELVANLAKRRPDWTFLMIGRVAVSDPPKLPNVHFIGKRPYDQLPEYGRCFDAAIIPYKLNQQVLHANPLKLREYLAMGVPIVSVRTPETEKYADVVDIASSVEEFLAKLDSAIRQSQDKTAVDRRLMRVAGESWNCRLDVILGHVQRTIESQSAPTDEHKQLAVSVSI